MTTRSWLTDINIPASPPAAFLDGFKDFITKFNDGLVSAGFAYQTSVGELDIPNMASVEGAYKTTGAHQIYYMNDSFHGTAPIYLRFSYSSGGYAYTPVIHVQAGTGHDGSGNLTGRFINSTYSYIATSGTTNLKCYACAIEGLSWLMFGEGWNQSGNPTSANTQGHGFVVARSTDAAGLPTADGVVVYMLKNDNNGFNATSRSFRSSWTSPDTTNDKSLTVGNNGSYAPRALGLKESVTADLQKQVVPHIIPFPEFQVMTQICSLLPDDNVSSGTQFKAAIKGVAERNYIAVHGFRARTAEVIALIWE